MSEQAEAELTEDKRKQIEEYCEQNQDAGWQAIADHFQVEPQSVFKIYMRSLIG